MNQAQRVRRLTVDGKYLGEILSRRKLDRTKRRNSEQKLTLQQKMTVHIFILNKRKPYASKVDIAVTYSDVAKTFWSTINVAVTCSDVAKTFWSTINVAVTCSDVAKTFLVYDKRCCDMQ